MCSVIDVVWFLFDRVAFLLFAVEGHSSGCLLFLLATIDIGCCVVGHVVCFELCWIIHAATSFSSLMLIVQVSKRQLRMFLEEAPSSSVPWAALREIVGEVNYGGRVTDENDQVRFFCCVICCVWLCVGLMAVVFGFCQAHAGESTFGILACFRNPSCNLIVLDLLSVVLLLVASCFRFTVFDLSPFCVCSVVCVLCCVTASHTRFWRTATRWPAKPRAILCPTKALWQACENTYRARCPSTIHLTCSGCTQTPTSHSS